MDKLWIFDLDDTIINNNHRKHHVFDMGNSNGEPLVKHANPDWDTFHSYDLMIQDACSDWTRGLWQDGKFLYGEHLIVTARDLRCEKGTRDSLLNLDLITQDTMIVMKPVRSHEPSNFYKARVALQYLETYHDREIVFVEDMPDIVATLRRLEHPRLTVVDATEPNLRQTIDRLGETREQAIARLEARIDLFQSLLPTLHERAAIKSCVGTNPKAFGYITRLEQYIFSPERITSGLDDKLVRF